jgi:RNA polymerase sigma-70 factor, ECF subfamily
VEDRRQDAELMSAAARGERDAFAEVFDRYGGVVYAIALRMLRSEGDAEDLVHDVFLEAWRDAARYDAARGALRTWLAVRTRSRALDRLSRARGGRHVALDEVEDRRERAAASTAHPAEVLAVRGALQVIPEDLRVVLEQTYFFGWTASEIAAALEIPLGTVKSRLARGLGLLRRSLEDETNDELGR